MRHTKIGHQEAFPGSSAGVSGIGFALDENILRLEIQVRDTPMLLI
jgi:hypothetical protein